MPADEPWNLVASGPRGDHVGVEYYAGLKKLKVLRTYDNNPLVVQLEPLPPGLHLIHAVTTVGDKRGISRGQTILFHSRNP